MTTFEFSLFGGYTITFEKEQMTIDVKGEKGWFFYRMKPRSKTIRYEDLLFIDYKEPGRAVGYVRFVTDEIKDYPSSQFVAQVDENSFLVERDEKEKYQELMMFVRKKLPNIAMNPLKM